MEKAHNKTRNRQGRIARAAGAVVLAVGLMIGIWGVDAATAQASSSPPGSYGSAPITATADPEQPASAEKVVNG